MYVAIWQTRWVGKRKLIRGNRFRHAKWLPNRKKSGKVAESRPGASADNPHRAARI
jgi:hypothetical protein